MSMDERARFEAWCFASYINIDTLDKYPGHPAGTYEDSRTHFAWLAWQAAIAELSSPTGRIELTDEQRKLLTVTNDVAIPGASSTEAQTPEEAWAQLRALPTDQRQWLIQGQTEPVAKHMRLVDVYVDEWRRGVGDAWLVKARDTVEASARKLAAHPMEAPPPTALISKVLGDAMDAAVSNGANSVSMPDHYVELAAWLAAHPTEAQELAQPADTERKT